MKKCLVFLIYFITGLTRVNAQESRVFTQKLSDSTQKAQLFLPKESVFLFFDKTNYNIGDTVWFKAVITVGGNHQLSELSNVLYVELIDNQDSIIKRSILYASHGLAFGDFTVNADCLPGTYRVRAYTKFMLNSGHDLFFTKSLPFVDKPQAKPGLGVSPTKVSFYPEGGALIEGIRSKVAVKVSTADRPIDAIRGIVVDDEKNEVANFTTGSNGFGVFAISPVKGKSYKVLVKQDVKMLVSDLPPAKPSGFTLTVNSLLNDSVYVNISGKLAFTETRPGYKVRIIAHSKGEIYYSAEGIFSGKTIRCIIPKKNLPPGIIQVGLVSSAGETLSLRNIFIKGDDKLSVEVKNEDNKGNVTNEIIVKNSADQLVDGSFAIAVLKLDDVLNTNPDINQGIYEMVELTSNYNSDIVNAANYLHADNRKSESELDLLMLTQEQFKYNWGSKNLTYTDSPTYLPEKTLSINGVIKTANGKIVNGAKVSLYALAAGLKLDTITNDQGYFSFADLDLADSTKLLISAEKKGIRDLNIYVALPEYPTVNAFTQADSSGSDNSFYPNKSNPKNKGELRSIPMQSTTHVLKEVKVKGKKSVKPDISNKYGTDSPYTISGKDLNELGPLSIGLRSKIPFVLYREGILYSLRAPGLPLHIVINNFEISPDEIDNYVSTDDVQDVKILHGFTYKLYYGIPYDAAKHDVDDIVLITTKAYAGTSKTTNSLKKLLLKISDEVGIVREKPFYTNSTPSSKLSFYFPGYTRQHTFSATSSSKTIYWNPNVIVNKNSEPSFLFRPNGKGTYLIKINGIDLEGNIGGLTYTFKVE
ncbi:MAG: hypothetical protein H7289_02905 [Mucilaginibacter sp.]|nr:hypothetical protein [Mucilaginibacter sp.]